MSYTRTYTHMHTHALHMHLHTGRAWHRSFNRWLIRYIYIPLGGNRVGASATTQKHTDTAGDATNSATAVKQQQWSSDAVKLQSTVHDTASRQICQDADASDTQALISSPPNSQPRNNHRHRYHSLWLTVQPLLRRAFNVFVVFTFVAFWHDRELKLLAWGWLIALLFVPELLLRALFSPHSRIPLIQHIRSAWYYRHLQATAAALCIYMMMIANLVGYSVGVDGTYHVLQKFFDEGGVLMCVITFAVFFSAAQLMFAVREDEEYRRRAAAVTAPSTSTTMDKD